LPMGPLPTRLSGGPWTGLPWTFDMLLAEDPFVAPVAERTHCACADRDGWGCDCGPVGERIVQC